MFYEKNLKGKLCLRLLRYKYGRDIFTIAVKSYLKVTDKCFMEKEISTKVFFYLKIRWNQIFFYLEQTYICFVHYNNV